MELPCDPAVPLLANVRRELSQYMIHVAQTRKLPRQSWKDEQLKQRRCVHTIELYSAGMGKEMVSFTEKEVKLITNMLR